MLGLHGLLALVRLLVFGVPLAAAGQGNLFLIAQPFDLGGELLQQAKSPAGRRSLQAWTIVGDAKRLLKHGAGSSIVDHDARHHKTTGDLGEVLRGGRGGLELYANSRAGGNKVFMVKGVGNSRGAEEPRGLGDAENLVVGGSNIGGEILGPADYDFRQDESGVEVGTTGGGVFYIDRKCQFNSKDLQPERGEAKYQTWRGVGGFLWRVLVMGMRDGVKW